MIILIVLAVIGAVLLGLIGWQLRRMRLLRLEIQWQEGYLAGFHDGRDHGYNAGVDDTRRGIEYLYGWKGNPVDDHEPRQAAGPDPRPRDGHVDQASGDARPGERALGGAAPGMGGPIRVGQSGSGDHAPVNDPGNPGRVDGQDPAAPVLAVPDHEAFWAPDALELQPLAAARYFAGLRAAIGDPGYPDRELEVWRDGYEQGADDEAASFGPDVLSLLGDTDAFAAIHTAFNTLWTDVIEPPYTLPAWPERCVR